MIKCNQFIVFLVDLECVKGLLQCARQKSKFSSRKNQVQSKKKKSFCNFDYKLNQSKNFNYSLTPCSIDQELWISKNLKCKKAHNLLVSSQIHDPFVTLFKGHHKPSLERFFRERNHCLCG